MFIFITVLRAIASCFITNSHYSGIYPYDLLANGGLLGNVIFFAVSGYCLALIKNDYSINGFINWYRKRLWRIYLPMDICTCVYMIIGYYKMSEIYNFVYWFVFPTQYAFIKAIMILYIPFFLFLNNKKTQKHLNVIMIMILVVAFLSYVLVYDRSYYHIDNVREPYILLLYSECMLLGAWFRLNNNKYLNKYNRRDLFLAAVYFALYFASKLVFSKGSNTIISHFQIINQIVIYVLLYYLFRTFMGLNSKLERMSKEIKKMISVIADMTLELYVVQLPIISAIRKTSIKFPLNWVIVTVLIISVAYLLHISCVIINRLINKCISNQIMKHA